MAADELLGAEAVRAGRLVVRVYGWRGPTLSLGAFQPLAAARALPGIDRVALVRRPSGGGAILHGTDVTYAAAVPRTHPLARSPRLLYDAFHEAAVEALAARGVAARLAGADERLAVAGSADFLCFDRRADGDVVVTPPGRDPTPGDPKILGSAQRRSAVAVVQHGSLLVRAADALAPAGLHAGMDDLHPGFAGDVDAFVADWMTRVARSLGGGLRREPEAFAPGRDDRIAALAAAYGAPAWIGRR